MWYDLQLMTPEFVLESDVSILQDRLSETTLDVEAEPFTTFGTFDEELWVEISGTSIEDVGQAEDLMKDPDFIKGVSPRKEKKRGKLFGIF